VHLPVAILPLFVCFISKQFAHCLDLVKALASVVLTLKLLLSWHPVSGIMFMVFLFTMLHEQTPAWDNFQVSPVPKQGRDQTCLDWATL
jgi:hypothetical protein